MAFPLEADGFLHMPHPPCHVPSTLHLSLFCCFKLVFMFYPVDKESSETGRYPPRHIILYS